MVRSSVQSRLKAYLPFPSRRGDGDDNDNNTAAAAANPPLPAPTTSTTEAARSSRINLLTLYSVIVAGASAAGFGYENAIIGPLAALPEFVLRYQEGMKDPAQALRSGGLTSLETVLSAVNQNLLFSIPLVGTIVGAVLASPLQHHLGRKGSLLACYAFSIAPLFLELFAPNLGAFVAARFWNGLSYGAALAIGPLYLADLVPAALRGRAVTSMNITTIAASVLATVTVWATQKRGGVDAYRIPLAVQCAIPVLLFVATLPLPESPVWLVERGLIKDKRDGAGETPEGGHQLSKARRSLKKLRAEKDDRAISLELLELIKAEHKRRELESGLRFWDIFRRDQLERTMVSGLIFSLNQVSGIILSTTFSALFLTQLGVADPFLLNVASSLCQFAGAIAAPLVVDRIGRRPLALGGISILAAIDFVAGALAFYTSPARPQIATTIAALSFIFNFFWTASFYAISLLIPSEYPAPQLRARTMSYAIFNGQLTAVVTTFVVPQLTSADAAALGAKTYLIFGGVCVIVVALAWVYLPETAGRTTREIEELYRRKIPKRKWKEEVVREEEEEETSVVEVRER